ncbi:MAG: alpha/beta-hydrolase N-terminal domain-containing protein, partial [Lysobacterales bacterium]
MPKKLARLVQAMSRTLSSFGVLVAALFFAASLSPSLLPRPFHLQGVLSGLALVSGYGCGVLLVLAWDYLGLPHPTGRLKRIVLVSIGGVCLGLASIALVYCNGWQNDLRLSMGMEANDSGQMAAIAAIALAVALLALVAVRLLIHASRWVSRKLKTRVPERAANLLGVLLVAAAVVLLVNDVFVKKFIDVMDEVYALSDAVTEPEVKQPSDPLATGSPASLVDWDTLGRTGENFVALGPDKEDLARFSDEAVMQPIRVYVGFRSAETFEARAQLALDELIRVDGFGRSKLIIATPTGTGWLDPSAVDTIEYIHRGDTAIVAMQYSYLP